MARTYLGQIAVTDIAWTNTTVKLGDLQPWARNPRKSSKKQAAKMLESWDRFGQVQTIAVSPSLQVLDGHQRLSALLTIHGKNYEVAARQASRELSEQEREQLVITLHTGAVGAWDWSSLANWNADSLQAYGFDSDALSQWNQDAASLGLLLESEKAEVTDPGPQIDRAAELQKQWKTELGQMWQLGEHRLICGDCTDPAVVERVMGGEKADMVCTDPPYNVDKAAWDTDVFPMLEHAADIISSILDDAGICFWFCATRYIPETIVATSALVYKWMFVWYPSNNMAHGDLGFQKFTAALVLSKGAKIWRENMQDLRDFPIRITNQDPGHPTPKPLELISYLVEMASRSIVFDPFAGSGTTGIACEQLGRKARMIEISPAYCGVILERFFQLTGIEPTLIE